MIDNKQKIILELHALEMIMAVYNLKTDKRKKYTLDLLADYKDMDTFIVANQVQSFRQINQVSKSELWMLIPLRKRICVLRDGAFAGGIVFSDR